MGPKRTVSIGIHVRARRTHVFLHVFGIQVPLYVRNVPGDVTIEGGPRETWIRVVRALMYPACLFVLAQLDRGVEHVFRASEGVGKTTK